jgi:hypothetical protein
MANGEGAGAAGAGVAPATDPATPIVVVTATAPTPAAFMKFLREYSMLKPPQTSLRTRKKGGVCAPSGQFEL